MVPKKLVMLLSIGDAPV